MGRLDKTAYVYIVFRPSGLPCYVGKGHGSRWKRHDRKQKQNPHFAAILAQAGGELPVAVIRNGLTDFEACEIEVALIAAIGRETAGGPLVNMTDGGDGTSGAVMTAEWREHRKNKAVEVWQRPEYREKVLRLDRGRSGNKNPRSDAFKSAVSEKLKGNTHTLGLKQSDEAKQKMRDHWADPVWREKLLAKRAINGMYSKEACAARWETRRKKALEASGRPS